MAVCVDCEAEFDLEEPDVGELVSCPECGIEMEIVSLKPIELEAIGDEEEDGTGLETDEDAGWSD